MLLFDRSIAAEQTLSVLSISALSFLLALYAAPAKNAGVMPAAVATASPSGEEPDKKSAGCVSCHTRTDEPTMHPTKTVQLGCTDCHGGNASIAIRPGTGPNSVEYAAAKEKAHVQPRNLAVKDRASLREHGYTLWLKESSEYVKFVNPGDLRVAPETCGPAGCHATEVRAVSTSMMTHSGLLWGAALYNNGGFPYKNAHFGESYSQEGLPQSIKTFPKPTPEETRAKGVLSELDPLYRWEISQPGNVLRVFERGGQRKAEIGNPSRQEDPGKPDDKLSDRGFGTALRTDPVFLGLQKTRLVDPVLSFPGTNDHPGDYRGSGCTACHVIYANDRDPSHSGPTRCSVIPVSARPRIRRFPKTRPDTRSSMR